MEQTRGTFGFIFDKLAGRPLANNVRNVVVHVGPVEVGLKVMKGLGKPHMATNGSRMELRNEGCTKRVVLVKLYPVLEIKEHVMEPVIKLRVGGRGHLPNVVLQGGVGSNVIVNSLEKHGVGHGKNEALAMRVMR